MTPCTYDMLTTTDMIMLTLTSIGAIIVLGFLIGEII